MRVHGHSLDDEVLRTLMCETEAVVNSQPLTVDTLSDPLLPLPLTPNTLLTGKTKLILPPPGKFQREDVWCLVNTLQMNFGQDGARSTCRAYKWDTSGHVNVGTSLKVMLYCWRTATLAETSGLWPKYSPLVRMTKVRSDQWLSELRRDPYWIGLLTSLSFC